MSGNLSLIIKNNLRSRKGLINVVKTYKTRGSIEAFIELIFLITDRLKMNPGKFIISRQAIYLYEDSKHLTFLEKILINRKNNNHNNYSKVGSFKKRSLQVENI